MTTITEADREAAAVHHAFKTWADVVHWASGIERAHVGGTAKLLATQREAYQAGIPALEAVAASAGALVAKLDVIHADSRYASVWAVNQMHVGAYDGPTYTDELAELRGVLDQMKEMER